MTRDWGLAALPLVADSAFQLWSTTTKTDSVWFTTKGLSSFQAGEDAGVPVKELLHKAATADPPLHMTEVNYAEVKSMLLKKDGAAAWEQAEDVLKSLPLEFHPATRPLADTPADFKACFKISLADAFAAALSKEKKAELVPGDGVQTAGKRN